jgi:hypothetical protein
LIEYKKVYPKYLENTTIRVKNCLKRKFQSCNKLFTFDDTRLCKLWHDLLKKTGNGFKDTETGRYKMHIYTLRKYFKKQLHVVGKMDEGIVRFLMGQKGYLSTYDDYINSPEILQKDYDAHTKYLEVFTDRETIEKELQPRIDKAINDTGVIASENIELKKRIVELEALQPNIVEQQLKFNKMENAINDLSKMVIKLSSKEMDYIKKDEEENLEEFHKAQNKFYDEIEKQYLVKKEQILNAINEKEKIILTRYKEGQINLAELEKRQKEIEEDRKKILMMKK